MALKGTLLDVFELSGRGGAVALLEACDGGAKVGDWLQIGDARWEIAGVEMVKYNADGLRRIVEGWKPPLGVLLRDSTKQELSALIGQEFVTLDRNENRSDRV